LAWEWGNVRLSNNTQICINP